MKLQLTERGDDTTGCDGVEASDLLVLTGKGRWELLHRVRPLRAYHGNAALPRKSGMETFAPGHSSEYVSTMLSTPAGTVRVQYANVVPCR